MRAAPRATRLLGLFGLAATLAVLAIAACSAQNPAAQSGDGIGNGLPPAACGPGVAGCPCSDEGATASCGHVVKQNGDYRTCSEGQTTCIGGKWGNCNGNRVYIQTAGDLDLENLNILAGDAATGDAGAGEGGVNPCDPNFGAIVTGTPGTISAPGVQGTDGGVSLSQSGTGGTGDAGTGPCQGLHCSVPTCAGNGTTTLNGIVYDPAGINPLYNATVYIPVYGDAALPGFNSGASCDTCSGAAPLASISTAQTDATGHFSLTGIPSGVDVPLVVQMGKWRREIVIHNPTQCAVNDLATLTCASGMPAGTCKLRLPKNQTDGWDPALGSYTKADMPHMALVSGSADPFQCMLLKAGIDPNEFGDNTSTRKFHYYASPDRPGMTLDSSFGANVSGATLWNDSTLMATYDALLLPCEGQAIDKKTNGNNPYQNLINYTDVGGRVFTTHYGYVWMEYPGSKSYVAAPDNWSTVATWTHSTGTTNTADPLTGTILTGFPKGAAFSSWLGNIGSLSGVNQLTLHEGRKDLSAVGPNTQGWITANSSGNYNPHFTFNTPYLAAAANQCGRTVFSDFHVSADAVVSSNKCVTNADCGFTDTCSGGSAGSGGTCSEPCLTASDCADSTYTCAGAAIGTCVPKTGCTTGSHHSSSNCNGACITSGTSCTTNNDCPAHSVCSGAAMAAQACTHDSDCNGGSCTYGADTATSCSHDSDCTAGTGGDCHSIGGGAHRCRYQTCQASCTSVCYCNDDADCASGGTCTPISGQNYGTCGSNTGNLCTTNANCAAGTTCQTLHQIGANTCANSACGVVTDSCSNQTDTTGSGDCPGSCGASATCVQASTNVATTACSFGTCSFGTQCTMFTDSGGAGACPAGTCAAGQACSDTSQSAGGNCAGVTCGNNGTCVDQSQAAAAGACGFGTCSFGYTCVGMDHTTGAGACGAGTCPGADACTTSDSVATGNCASATCATGTSCTEQSQTVAAGKCSPNPCSGGYSCASQTHTTGNGNCTSNPCTGVAGTSCSSSVTAAKTGGLCPGTCAAGACVDQSGTVTAGKCSTNPCTNPSTCTSIAHTTGNGNCTTNPCAGVAGTSCSSAVSVAQTAGLCPGTCAAGSCVDKSGTVTGGKCSTNPCNGATSCATIAHTTGNGSCAANPCTAPATCSGTVTVALAGGTCPAACGTGSCVDQSQAWAAKTCAANGACGGVYTCADGPTNTTHHATTSCNGGSNPCGGTEQCTLHTGASITGSCATNPCGADACKNVGGGKYQCDYATCETHQCQRHDCETYACDSYQCQAHDCETYACDSYQCQAHDCEAYACDSYQCQKHDCQGHSCDSHECEKHQCQSHSCLHATCDSYTCKSHDCAGGRCVGAENCYADADCGPTETCSGGTRGACSKVCATSADCTGGETCTAGHCTGCATAANCKDKAYPSTCTGASGQVTGTCAIDDSDHFPEGCKQGTLTPQESALEFMFFDLTACVSTDTAAPPPPPAATYGAASFSQDYTATCTSGTTPVWREVDWLATIPNTASIEFSGQTGPTTSSLTPASPLEIVSTTASTTGTTFAAALIDTGTSGTGAFSLASPPVVSSTIFRLTITLTPTTGGLQSPLLQTWQVWYDCVPNE